MTQVWKVAARFGIQEVTDEEGSTELVVDDIAVTCHVQAADSYAASLTFPLELCFAVGRWWDEDLEDWGRAKSRWRPSTVLLDVSCWPILPVPDDPAVWDAGESQGTFGFDLSDEAPQVAYLVGLRTLVDTRRGRGRVYYPAGWGHEVGPGPAGNISPEDRQHLANITAKLAAHFREISDDEAVLCVYSREDVDGHAVTHFVVPDRKRTQRRRALRPAYTAFGLTGDPA